MRFGLCAGGWTEAVGRTCGVQLHRVWVEEFGSGVAELRLKTGHGFTRILTDSRKGVNHPSASLRAGSGHEGSQRKTGHPMAGTPIKPFLFLSKQAADRVFYCGPCA